MAFSFENLKVYRDSQTWVELIYRDLDSLGHRCPKAIQDQLRRAALSIPLNIAEGTGRWHKAEKRQFYWVARGSVFECVALVQTMARMALLKDDVSADRHGRLTELAMMLNGLIKSVDNLQNGIRQPSPPEATAPAEDPDLNHGDDGNQSP
jgi:four helix bundle protein